MGHWGLLKAVRLGLACSCELSWFEGCSHCSCSGACLTPGFYVLPLTQSLPQAQGLVTGIPLIGTHSAAWWPRLFYRWGKADPEKWRDLFIKPKLIFLPGLGQRAQFPAKSYLFNALVRAFPKDCFWKARFPSLAIENEKKLVSSGPQDKQAGQFSVGPKAALHCPGAKQTLGSLCAGLRR